MLVVIICFIVVVTLLGFPFTPLGKRFFNGGDKVGYVGREEFSMNSIMNNTPVVLHTVHNGQKSRNEGWNVTDTLVALGAPRLPEGAVYYFFPVLVKYVMNRVSYQHVPKNFENSLVIEWPEIPGKMLGTAQLSPAPTVQKSFIAAAKEAYAEFKPLYEDRLEEMEHEEFSKKILNFVQTGEEKGRTIIGKRQKWVEDN